MNLEAERKLFEEQGYIGPFKLWEPEEMTAWWKDLRKVLLDPKSKEGAAYQNPVNYDRHLDIPALTRIVSEAAIVRRFQALIGSDILCWRTEFFPKNPGDSGTGWHQVENYAIGEAERGVLEPTNRSEGIPMELTTWIALTEATRENGCLKMLPGSHKTWHYDESVKMRFDLNKKSNTLFGYDYGERRIDKTWSPDEDKVAHMEMKPGEFIIFTARCVHGSNPNVTRKQRMGFAARVVPTHVKVYSGMTEFNEFGHHFPLQRHGCVLVGGKDAYGHNRIVTESLQGTPFVTL